MFKSKYKKLATIWFWLTCSPALELSPKGHISSEPEVVIIWFLKTHKEMCLMRQCTAKTILNNGPFVSSAALILLNSVFSGRAVDFLS